jgi:voltage-gated potassium channel
LILFLGLLLGAAFLLQLSGAYPQATFIDLFVDAFHLVMVERVVQLGDGVLPGVLTFMVPLLAILILGEGFMHILTVFIARGRHREEWDRMVAKTFKNHIIISGVGELGRALVQKLLERDPAKQIVLIDPRPGFINDLGLLPPNVSHIESDMTNLETLEAANCKAASLVIIASGSDTLNLEAAFKVHQLNPELEIWVRLYRNQLTNLLEITKKPNIHFFCPYQSAADILISQIKN